MHIESTQGAAIALQSQTYETKARQFGDTFESMFLFQALEKLDAGVPTVGGGGFGEKMFRGIRNEYLADSLTDKTSGGLGISDNIYNELIKAQENR